ncbi:MAG: coenzyme F420-0:L-glutamate ligase [Micrococcales bacterium]|nr:coenzyme F420-0:L-glutamate ligase [Micrococcales bacterium]HNP15178.1 coenzyme F420-0:L-glutamate ligase [Terrimesophilobacter sp.]
MPAKANDGKQLDIEVDGVRYQRIPLRTKLIGPDDDLIREVANVVEGTLEEGDLLFVTEKIVAITQGRSLPIDSIVPRPLAVRLSSRVTKTPAGIGLGMPQTMEMALRECGTPRILLAAAASVIGKLFGRRGTFYRVAGPKARGIDGPTTGTIPPYDSSVVLAPDRPKRVARQLGEALGAEVLIVDINDFGGNVLGSTLPRADEKRVERILADNPLGQGTQSTPLGIIRRVA